tara:strand:+ start:1005 stop:2069 length:1065 start_codon:yes stop_codon:yes gene_type:complete
MRSIEIQNLDQHLRPLQVGGVSTGLELSTESLRISSGELQIKNIIAETSKVDGDLTVDGKIYLTGSNSDIEFENNVVLDATTTDDMITIRSKGMLLDATTSYTNEICKLNLSADSGYDTGVTFMEATTSVWTIGNDASDSSQFKIGTGADVSTSTKLTLNSSGLLTVAGDIVAGDDIAVASTGKINFDGIGGDTYVYEHSADHLRLVVGGDNLLRIYEQGDDGNQFNFVDASIGFTQLEPTFDATTTTVDFRFSNKQNLTFLASNITNIALTFPAMSGNFVLLLKQDGTGSRTVTNWKAMESDESAADGSAGVVWAGGSAPTLTTDANHVDILSFYWDADNEIAYGVATLDFQF